MRTRSFGLMMLTGSFAGLNAWAYQLGGQWISVAAAIICGVVCLCNFIDFVWPDRNGV